MFNVFVRDWYEKDGNGNIVPCSDAPKTFLGFDYSLESAREKCREWNSENEPGELSRKAEFE